MKRAAPAMRVFETAWGTFGVVASAKGITRVVLPAGRGHVSPSHVSRPRERSAISEKAHRFAALAEREIREYLAGRRRAFTVPLDLDGVSAFQRKVLLAERRVPYGTTLTYGDLAARIGHPGAARAVGGALARNPVPLLVPCHRTVAAGGGLGGFGGGLALKRRLLALEGLAK